MTAAPDVVKAMIHALVIVLILVVGFWLARRSDSGDPYLSEPDGFDD